MIPVKNEAVRAFLLSVQASDKELDAADDVDSKVSIYGSLLNECIDALQSLRDELKNDPVRGFCICSHSFNRIGVRLCLWYISSTCSLSGRSIYPIGRAVKSAPNLSV